MARGLLLKWPLVLAHSVRVFDARMVSPPAVTSYAERHGRASYTRGALRASCSTVKKGVGILGDDLDVNMGQDHSLTRRTRDQIYQEYSTWIVDADVT